MPKHLVCLSDGNRVENIIDATLFNDLFLEYSLLASDEEQSSSKFNSIKDFIDKYDRQLLRMRYNSQRNPKLYVWECEYTYGKLWDLLEENNDYANLVREHGTELNY